MYMWSKKTYTCMCFSGTLANHRSGFAFRSRFRAHFVLTSSLREAKTPCCSCSWVTPCIPGTEVEVVDGLGLVGDASSPVGGCCLVSSS